MHACRSNSHFVFFLVVFFSFLPTRFFFYFLVSLFKFLFLNQGSRYYFVSLFTARPSFYNACRDQILLFKPLTSFVWSGYTGQPSLFRLCATPHHQTKKGILFVCLPWHPFLLWSGSFSLHIPHDMHLVVLTQLASFG